MALYKGEAYKIPLIAPGLGYLRNTLVAPPDLMENIRNCYIHQLGLNKRGGTAISDTMSGSAKVVGLKQYVSEDGFSKILRATDDGKLWISSTTSVKTGLTTRGPEILTERDFATHAYWNVSGDFDDTGGNLTYTHNTGSGITTQPLDSFESVIKPNTLYEFSYTVSSSSGDAACILRASKVSTVDTSLTISDGAQTTQFTSNSSPLSFSIAGSSTSGGFTLDNVSLKEVVTSPVDISIYNKKAIFTNGWDPPQVYKGLSYLRPPEACIAGNAEEGPGNLDNNTYSYKATFVNSYGETSGGDVSNEVEILDNTVDGQIRLNSIPLGPIDVTSRKIYRTEGGDSTYKLLTTLSDNTTITYLDNTADGSLGATIPNGNAARGAFEISELGSEGIDPPDALTADNEGPDPCTAALAGAGAGNVTNGTHSYVVAFVDADSLEGLHGIKSNVITVADSGVDGQVSLTDIAVGPTGTTDRIIYRTKAGDSGYWYYLTAMGDNSTTTYTDNIADASLGGEVLNENDFATHADWYTINDWDDTSGYAEYTHNVANGSGTLYQPKTSLQTEGQSGRFYEFTYEVTNVTGTAPASLYLYETFPEVRVDMNTTVAVHTTTFFAKTDPTHIQVIALSTDTGTLRLDNVYIKRIAKGASGVDAGSHSYKVTYINSHGETIGSDASNQIVTTSYNGYVTLSSIPVGSSEIKARRVYRTKAGDTGDYYLLVTIPDNTTTTYTDKVADSDLGSTLPTSSTADARPSDWTGYNNPRYAFEHASGNTEGIIFFGCPDNLDTVYIIPDGTEDASDSNIKQFTFKTRNIRNRNIIVGGREYGTNLLMFSQELAWVIDKSSLDIADWTYKKVPWKGGTINNRTLVEVGNDIHSMELDGNIYTIHRVQESGDTSIASLTKPTIDRPQDIDRWIDDNVDLNYSEDFHGVFDEDLRAVLWFVVRQGQTQIDTALTYFIDHDRWVILDNRTYASGFSAFSSTSVTNSDGSKTVYTGDYSGNVWKLNQSDKNDDSNGYWAGIKTHSMLLPPEKLISRKGYDKLFIIGEENVGVNLEVEGFIDGTSTTAASVEMDSDYIQYKLGNKGRRVQVEIYNETADEDFFLEGLVFYLQDLGLTVE